MQDTDVITRFELATGSLILRTSGCMILGVPIGSSFILGHGNTGSYFINDPIYSYIPPLFGEWTAGVSSRRGAKLIALDDCSLSGVYKLPNCTATIGYLEDSSHNILTSGLFAGNVWIPQISGNLISGTTYYATADNGGAGYTSHYRAVTSYPYTGSLVKWTAGWNGASDNGENIFEISGCLVYTDNIGIYHNYKSGNGILGSYSNPPHTLGDWRTGSSIFWSGAYW